MNTIGNILWIILGGFIIFFIYLFGSLVLMITIVGIPFGLQTLKLAILSLFPFGKEIRIGERSEGCLYIIMNVIWILVAGIELAITHLVLAFIFGITIIGIPFAVQHFKLARLAILPFGNDIVSQED